MLHKNQEKYPYTDNKKTQIISPLQKNHLTPERDPSRCDEMCFFAEICEEPDFPRPYMMKRPDPGESFYAATDIIHHVSTLFILKDILC